MASFDVFISRGDEEFLRTRFRAVSSLPLSECIYAHMCVCGYVCVCVSMDMCTGSRCIGLLLGVVSLVGVAEHLCFISSCPASDF